MWYAVLIDLEGSRLGELRNASDRVFGFALNRLSTAAARVDADNPGARHIVRLDETLLKLYDDSTGAKVLRFLGPITSYEKVRNAQGGTVAFTAAGLAWRLGHRLVGKAAGGANVGTPLAMVDRGEIVRQVVEALNRGDAATIHTTAADTGIRMGSVARSSDGYVEAARYKPADQVIAELAAALDGFDWEVVPVEPTVDSLGVQMGTLNVAAAIGQQRDEAAWEYGTQKANVAEFRDVGNAAGLGNLGYQLPPGFPENTTQQVLAKEDPVSRARRGLHEIVVPGDLTSDALRQKLLDQHIAIRAWPQRTITFTPTAEDPDAAIEERRVPRLFADFNIGDTMPFRAVESFQVVDADGRVTGYEEVATVDALFRCYGAELRPDAAGVVQPTLTMISEGG